MESLPQYSDIVLAAKRIGPYAHRTPVLTSACLDQMFGAKLFFKAENLQKVGAFKFRGACNAVFSLPGEQAKRGVLTHSSGNHAQALALAAKLRGIQATVVMPNNASAVKKRAVSGYGAKIIECEPTQDSREQTTEKAREETGATFIHPYNDPRIIAGQGTSVKELLEDYPDLDIILVPVGGGGLASGTALTVAGMGSLARVIAVEPAGADDAYRSLKDGKIRPSIKPKTIADGLLTSLGDLTYAVLKKHLDSVVLVSEENIAQAMRLVWERMKTIIEPSSSVVMAAIIEKKIDITGKKVGLIISGGNVDLDNLPW